MEEPAPVWPLPPQTPALLATFLEVSVCVILFHIFGIAHTVLSLKCLSSFSVFGTFLSSSVTSLLKSFPTHMAVNYAFFVLAL